MGVTAGESGHCSHEGQALDRNENVLLCEIHVPIVALYLQETDVTFQRGVLRTNCIDCLDRTNVAQFVLGLHALEAQLHALGVSDSLSMDIQSSMARELMSLYEQMGDTLARQVLDKAAGPPARL